MWKISCHLVVPGNEYLGKDMFRRLDPERCVCLGHERNISVCDHMEVSMKHFRSKLDPYRGKDEEPGTYHHSELCEVGKHLTWSEYPWGREPFLVLWPQGFKHSPTRKPELEIVRFFRLRSPTQNGHYKMPFSVKGSMVVGFHPYVLLSAAKINQNACPHINLGGFSMLC